MNWARPSLHFVKNLPAKFSGWNERIAQSGRHPHPFPARDRAAGYRYQLSILQAEFSLTQVLDQPVTGRRPRRWSA
jgi:hypothetical protein